MQLYNRIVAWGVQRLLKCEIKGYSSFCRAAFLFGAAGRR